MQKYQHEPNKQVVDLSSCISLSKDEDYNEALDLLKHKPRLAVVKAWLSAAADVDSRQKHLNRVVELSKMQNDNRRGFLVISEPLVNEEEESSTGLFVGVG